MKSRKNLACTEARSGGSSASMKEAHFGIDGMTCGGCVAAVRNVLTRQPGVSDVKVEIGSASLSYDDSAVNLEALYAAVERAGFQPQKA